MSLEILLSEIKPVTKGYIQDDYLTLGNEKVIEMENRLLDARS